MKWTPSQDFFEIEPVASTQVWGKPTAWPTAPVQDLSWRDDDEKKRLFGIVLGKLKVINLNNAFKAGCEIFDPDTTKALWVANNWLNDSIVLEAFNLYAETVNPDDPPLDKEAFARKVLELAEAKIQIGDKIFYEIHEPKDRLAYLRLYAETKGYVGKVDISNTTNFIHNEMKVKLVKPDIVEPKTIEGSVTENVTEHKPNDRFKIKLVS